MNRTKILRVRSEKNIHLVRQALDALNTAVHNATQLVFCLVEERERECDYEIKFVSSQKMTELAGSNKVIGCCDKANKLIYVRLGADQWTTNKQQIIYVLMHEILHAIGLHHREERCSLMNAEDTGVRGVTPYEITDILTLLNETRSDKNGEANNEV